VRVDKLRLGVLARSRKENERRLAIHPLHVERIAADLRAAAGCALVRQN
jgi:hypothetical protein